MDELLARVRAWMRRTQMAAAEVPQQSVFENGPLRIDYAAGCAYLDVRSCISRQSNTSSWCSSPHNAGKVLTHTFITREIWGTSWESDIASLRVFMATLRKKIEPDAAHPKLIQTHVGVGYRMQHL